MTAKLQYVNAYIIASFRRRYQHRQIELALDVKEQRQQDSIYMLDQLTAIKWINLHAGMRVEAMFFWTDLGPQGS
uniref:Uncharacterized protein n=1 Tax=Peronospora matthiolae TaxID=2874970 RepID=A0AAV1TZB9_9STRA